MSKGGGGGAMQGGYGQQQGGFGNRGGGFGQQQGGFGQQQGGFGQQQGGFGNRGGMYSRMGSQSSMGGKGGRQGGFGGRYGNQGGFQGQIGFPEQRFGNQGGFGGRFGQQGGFGGRFGQQGGYGQQNGYRGGKGGMGMQAPPPTSGLYGQGRYGSSQPRSPYQPAPRNYGDMGRTALGGKGGSQNPPPRTPQPIMNEIYEPMPAVSNFKNRSDDTGYRIPDFNGGSNKNPSGPFIDPSSLFSDPNMGGSQNPPPRQKGGPVNDIFDKNPSGPFIDPASLYSDPNLGNVSNNDQVAYRGGSKGFYDKNPGQLLDPASLYSDPNMQFERPQMRTQGPDNIGGGRPQMIPVGRPAQTAFQSTLGNQNMRQVFNVAKPEIMSGIGSMGQIRRR